MESISSSKQMRNNKSFNVTIKLKHCGFSPKTKLDSLDVESGHENNIKFFKKAISNFAKFLKDTFSLTPKAYYTKLYGGLGLSFGLLFGMVFLSSWERSLGIIMGLIFCMMIG